MVSAFAFFPSFALSIPAIYDGDDDIPEFVAPLQQEGNKKKASLVIIDRVPNFSPSLSFDVQ